MLAATVRRIWRMECGSHSSVSCSAFPTSTAGDKQILAREKRVPLEPEKASSGCPLWGQVNQPGCRFGVDTVERF